MDYDLFDDKQLVEGILRNDRKLIEYFFVKKCDKLFAYILNSVFDNTIDKSGIVSELYLYLAKDNWKVIRSFHFRSSLMTYVSVVAIRYFQKIRSTLIDTPSKVALYDKTVMTRNDYTVIESRIDVESALLKMPNSRYRKVIEMLDLQGMNPEDLADEMGVKVDNLYNIHRRAINQMRIVMGIK